MKKTLSILLIITMLLSVVVMAIPAYADTVASTNSTSGTSVTMPTLPDKGVTNAATGATAVTQPTYNEATLGNKVIANMSEQEKANYIAALERDGYIPVVATKIDGKTPANAVLQNQIVAGGKYYLWEDITWSSNRGDVKSSPIAIDGVGHKITVTVNNMFSHTKGITLKNLTIYREAPIEAGNKEIHILAQWDMEGVTTIENVTIDVDFNINKNTHTSDGTGSFIYYLRPGSSVKNVLNISNININSEVARMNVIAGFASGTEGAVTVDTLVNRGTININNPQLSANYTVGGIFGEVSGSTTLNNCFNEMNINVKAGSTLGSGTYIGGIAGIVNNGATIKNSVNTGNITVGETGMTEHDTKVLSIGGIAGDVRANATINADINSSANTYTLENCHNRGNITLNDSVLTTYANDTEIAHGIAGIAGRVSDTGDGKIAIKNCVNHGNIISNGKIVRAFAGILGSGRYAKGVSIINCINNGKLNINVRLGGRDYSSAAGIYAFQYNWPGDSITVRIYNCTNNGEIKETSTANVENGKLMRAGIIAVLRGIKDATIYNCINNGEILSGAQTHGENIAGGIVAYYATIGGWMGVKGTDSTLTIERCTNTKKVQSKGNAGGMLSSTGEIYDGGQGKVRYVTFKECLNTGAIERAGGGNAGGISGYLAANTDGSNTSAKLAVSYENCENRGSVTASGNNVAGIAGGLSGVAFAPMFSFKNCENTGAVNAGTGAWNVGGIGGWISTAATNKDGTSAYTPGVRAEGCVNNAAISAKGDVAGIFGHVAGNDGTTVKVTDCYNGVNGVITTAGSNARAAGVVSRVLARPAEYTRCYNLASFTVKDGGNWSGGITSQIEVGATFNNCENYGNITYSSGDAWYDSSDGSQNWGSIGGIAGGVRMQSTVSLSGCKNYGKIELGAATTNAGIGGVMGHAWNGSTVTFTKCENHGEVINAGEHGGDNSDIMGTGGIIGTIGRHAKGSTVYIYGCKNTASVSLTADSTEYSVGGIVGFLVKGSVTIDKSTDGVKTVNTGAVSTAATGGELYGAGGIIGRAGTKDYEVTVSIKNTENRGAITSTGTTYNLGGIAGMLLRTKGTLEDCTNTATGVITDNATNHTHYQGVAGIVGFAFGYNGNNNVWLNMTNCNNYAAINVSPAAGSAVGVAGIVGWVRAIPTVTLDTCRNEGIVTSNRYGAGIMGAYGTVGTWAGANQTSLKFIDCVNTGKIEAQWKGAGMLAQTEEIYAGDGNPTPTDRSYTHDFIFERCINSGSIWSIDRAGGMVAILNPAGGKSGVTFSKCQNNASVISRDQYAGGMVGDLPNGALLNLDIDDCINTGAISSTNSARVAGILGSLTVGSGKSAQINATINDCVNTGNITGKTSPAAGIVSYAWCEHKEGEEEATKAQLKLDIKSVLNTGNITAGSNGAGGIFGLINNSNDKSEIRITDAVNTGTISSGFEASGGNAGGIFGVVSYAATDVYLDGVINWGTVTTKEWNCFGIYGQNDHNLTGQYSEIKNAINFGKLESSVAGSSKETPIGYVSKTENVYYYAGSIDDGAVYSSSQGIKAQTYARAFSVLNTICDKAFTYMNVEAALPGCEPYFEKSDKYAEDTVQTLRDAYAKGTAMVELPFYGIDDAGEVYFVKQSAIEAQAQAILDAIEGLVLKSEMPALLIGAIEAAEKFAEENKNLYKDEEWNAFVEALDAAKKLRAQGNLQEMNFSTIYPIATELKNVQAKLEKDESTLGTTVITEEDFAALDGLKGEFELKADITVTKPLKNFKGTLIGNGHTITLDGCALFEKVEGATVKNVTIVGDAGEAKAIFGSAAKGAVLIENVTVDVDGALEATFFAAVDAKTEITVDTAFITSDASVAALVAGACKITATNVLVMAKAPALVTAEDATITKAYLDGVVYYNGNGEKITDAAVFASGEVTYVMNAAMGFNDVLVQRLGAQALPVIEKRLADDSNLVRYADGAYYNLGTGIGVIVGTPAKPEAPATLVLSELEKSIARAEAIAEGIYTEATMTELAKAIEAAKAALEADNQADIDAAMLAVEIAIASLETIKEDANATVVDTTKLVEAIAKAEALKMSDYTAGSWATVSVMLSMAKAAKIADNQAEVDAAVAALESATNALVKAPVVETKPVVDNNDASDDEATDDGCGGVVGTAAVIAIAVFSLGAGITFKKKED